jgi:hypothetical protein
MTLACNDPSEALRSMSAVLVRKFLTRAEGTWPKLTAATHAGVKAGLLHALAGESSASVRSKIGHALAEVAAQAAGEGAIGWPELLPGIFALAAAPVPAQREAALLAFTAVVQYTGSQVIESHAATLLSILTTLLSDSAPTVAVAALKATCAVIETLESDDARDVYKSLVPLLFSALERSFQASEESAQEAIEALIQVLSEQNHFFRNHLDKACTSMIAIIAHGNLDDATRKLAMEFLLVLAEIAGATVRKLPRLVESILKLALNFLATVDEDDGEWAASDDSERNFVGEADGDALEKGGFGAEACDRLARAVGGKILLPIFIAETQPMLSSTDWRARRAALLATGLVAEGSRRAMAPNLRTLTIGVLRFFDDAHPRVRHAAVRSMGQMCVDFGEASALNADGGAAEAEVAAGALGRGAGAGAAARARAAARVPLKTIQEVAGDIVLPALVAAAGAMNAAVPRVRGLAAAAIVNLLTGDEDSRLDALVETQGEVLLRTLVAVLQEVPVNFHSARSNALSALACVAGTLEEAFAPFYASVLPGLKATISAPADSPEALVTRGKALEALSVVCEAVGKERSGVDAAECLNFIVKAQSTGFAEDDSESFKYFIAALARLASCLGADFAPYIGFTLPYLLAKANTEVKAIITDAEEEDVSTARMEVSTVEIKGVGARRVAVDSTALEEKKFALGTLAEMTESLGVSVPAFQSALDAIAAAFKNGASSEFASIRVRANEGLAPLFQAALADTTPATSTSSTRAQRLLDDLIPFYSLRLQKERENDVFFNNLASLVEVARLAYESTSPEWTGPDGAASGPPGTYRPVTLPFEHFPELFKALKASLARIDATRAEARKAIVDNPDVDDEDLEKLQDNLAAVDEGISHVVDTVGYCIKTHGSKVVPILSADLGPDILKWLNEKEEFSIPRRTGAICLADDLIEFAGEAVSKNIF